MKNYTKIGLGIVVAGLVGLGAIGCRVRTIVPYLKADVQSELQREPSKGHPTEGLDGIIERTGEHLKTTRDAGLFLINDFSDDKKEYEIIIDKKTNSAQVYLENNLVREFKVGTGKEKDVAVKTRFGQYVTPNGDYLIINIMDQEELAKKFGREKAEEYYANGMLQLSGPWAPHIAIHATPDPEKIGHYKSNGCINVTPEEMEWFLENIGIGTKVKIK